MKKYLLAIAISASFISSVYAFNTDFLSYSPVFYFTALDTKIMQSTTENVLNTARDNSRVSWSNPKSGAHGYVIPSHSTTRNGSPCRTLTLFNEANHVTGQATYRFCKINNEWRIVN